MENFQEELYKIMDMKTIFVPISKELHDNFVQKIKSKDEHASISQIVRKLIQDYIKRK